MKALESLYEAQKIAFSPFVFQTVYTMSSLGILDELHEEKAGLTIPEIAERCKVSEYGVRVLVEMASVSGVVDVTEEERYTLTKIGYFLARDEMTRVNLMFTQDICYKGLFYLKDSIVEGRAAGLKELGPWKTIYEGLSVLSPALKKSWFEFDHHYSDNSFNEALKIIFSNNPKRIFDIGGNTGKWAIASTRHDPNVQVSIFDLPGQLGLAKENIQTIDEIKDRIDFNAVDMLDPASEIPAGADVYWMSQFLDCFSEQEIEQILLKIKKHIKPEATIFIMETFIDDQRFKAAEFSLIATSLYFTAMANGNSKMYSSSAMKYIVEKAGFKTVAEHRLHLDRFHTILEVQLNS